MVKSFLGTEVDTRSGEFLSAKQLCILKLMFSKKKNLKVGNLWISLLAILSGSQYAYSNKREACSEHSTGTQSPPLADKMSTEVSKL